MDQLYGFGRDTGTDLDGVAASVRELVAPLARAIPSLLGLTVTMVGAVELTLTGVAPTPAGPPLTSLGFSILQPGGTSARLVLYAQQPGALVDLAADFSYLERQSPAPVNVRAGTPTNIHLDQDLPGPPLVPGLTGVDEQAALSRAEGTLINDGVHPDDASQQLRRQASAAGIDLHSYARQLLDACVHPG